MHNRLVSTRFKVVLATALAFAAALPATAAARPKPGYRPGFRLFGSVNSVFLGNKVSCRVLNEGQICSAAGSTQGGGGFWPAGTANQYIFNTGLQIAGIVDSASTVGTHGQVDGSFFFNASGGGNGKKVTDVWNSADPNDLANWPKIAYVPPDSLYAPAKQGSKVASNNDLWFMSWEGDPSVNNARGHPLGVAVETRGLSFATPDRADLLFFIYNVYNVTASDPHVYDSWQATRPELADTLRALGVRFQALNEPDPAVGAIPDGGYTIKQTYLAFGADMDVTFENSGQNYDGVNVPFATGYTYQSAFLAEPSWNFSDASIYGPSFIKGAGFVGVKYLRSPIVNGQEVGLTLFSGFSNGAEFSDPSNSKQLYRYLSGKLDPAQGDDACNVGDVTLTHICFLNQGEPADMRFFQSTGPIDLAPGQGVTIAVAYLFAAPLKIGACVAPNGPAPCNKLKPQLPTLSLTRMTQPDSVILGVNTIDSMTGFNGFIGDTNGNGKVDQNEINVVPGSLLGKALTAQNVFNTKFAAPDVPTPPDFFLIPGDGQVTVIWKPSTSEQTGDSYCDVAKGPGTLEGAPTGAPPASYDPNFRCHDVEGYRIYRGTRGDAASLQLLAQFDKAGTVFTDSTGQVNQVAVDGTTSCDPDRAVFVSCTSAGVNHGVNLIQGIDVPLTGTITQWTSTISNPPVSYVTKADTAITGGGTRLPDLRDTGVPLVFVDKVGACQLCGVTTSKRYFYVVTAFDVNSIRSGSSSLESSKTGTKVIVPTSAPQTGVNTTASSTFGTPTVVGRHGPLPAGTDPTLDATTGKFSGPFPPANGLTAGFASFLTDLASAGQGQVDVTLDSMQLGSAWDGIPNLYFVTIAGGGDHTSVTLGIAQDPTDIESSAGGAAAVSVADASQAGKFGGTGYPVAVNFTSLLEGNYYTNAWGRGCINGAAGFTAPCNRNGPRWFDGPSPTTNETVSDPQANHPANSGAPAAMANFNNAGALTGVTTIMFPQAYETAQNVYRQVEGALGGAQRAADYNVYWGTGGKVDSVIDVTHDVLVKFDSTMIHGGTWGFLNQANANDANGADGRAVLSSVDFGCVAPLNSFGNVQAIIPCAAGQYFLSQTAVPGQIALWSQNTANAATAPIRAGLGFGMYLSGNIFMFELAGAVPASGTVWSLRTYIGAVGGNSGAYAFTAVPRTFSAVGASLRLTYNVSRTVAAAKIKLGDVHTIPDPYYVTSSYETSIDNKIIKFVNLPAQAIIRIYSASGVLVRVLEHNSITSNEEIWDVRNRGGQFVASGVYFWHVESGDARRVGRMTIVNFAK
jgi:hypothetical protein